MTESILSTIQNISGPYGYMLLCVFAFVENIVPPIPGDTVTVFGAYLAGTGKLNFFGVVVSTTIGSFAGFMLMFFLGKALGRKFFFDRDVSLFSKKDFIRVTGWFEKFGYSVVLANRFLSGARSVISLCAGITNLNAAKVALYSFFSCFVWNLLLVFAGCKVGENWSMILGILKKYNIIVLCAITFILLLFAARTLYRRNSRNC